MNSKDHESNAGIRFFILFVLGLLIGRMVKFDIVRHHMRIPKRCGCSCEKDDHGSDDGRREIRCVVGFNGWPAFYPTYRLNEVNAHRLQR